MNKILTVLLVLAIICGLSASSIQAQTEYEKHIQKIHFTYFPVLGSNGTPIEHLKTIGSVTPQVKVYIVGDLSETYTRKFFQQDFDRLLQKYGSTTQFVFVHNLFLPTENDLKIAMIGECAAAQNQFWSNIQPIIDHSSSELNYLLTDDVSYLQNVDQKQLQTCLKDPQTKLIVQQAEDHANYLGLNYIPTFILEDASQTDGLDINLIGGQGGDLFDQAMADLLGKTSSNPEISDLKTQVEQLQSSVNQVETKQNALSAQVQHLTRLIQQLFARIKALFGS